MTVLDAILTKAEKIYIVGAQSRAKALAGMTAFLYPKLSVAAYLGSCPEANA